MTNPIHILYVDDSRLDRELVLDALEIEAGGFQVVEATSREEFETALSQGEFDLVLTDFNILGYEGLQVLDTVHARYTGLPVIIVTGTGSEEVAVEAMKRGAADYVIKSPRHIHRLPQSIRSVLDNARLQEERTQAVEALRESEARLNEAQRIARIGSWRYQPDGSLSWSDQMYELLQWPRHIPPKLEAVLSAVQSKDLSGESTSALMKAIQSDAADFESEYSVTRPDGAVQILHEVGMIHRDENGQLIDAVGTTQDITERKQTEAEIHYHASLIEEVSDAIISTDTNFAIRSWNKAAEVIYGWKEAEVIGKSVDEVAPTSYPHDKPAQVLQQFRSAGFWRGEAIQKRKDGTPLHILSSVSLIYDSVGNPSGAVAVNRDITDRVRTEQIIQQQLQRLRALHTIDQAIAFSFNSGIIFDVLLKQVIAQLEVDAAALLLLNQPMQMLEYAAGRGLDFRALQRMTPGVNESYAWRAVLTRHTIHSSNLNEEGGELGRALLRARAPFVDYYGVPLIAKGQVKGVLELYHRTPLDPNPEWLGFLEMLAGQAAIAIENAQLFEDLQRSNTELTLAYDATIQGWSRAMDLRDEETEGHTARVTELTLRLAKSVGMSKEQIINVRRGALLHDIGKLGVPDNILLKSDKLTDEEWAIMRQHPQNAYNMLAPIAYLAPALDIPYCHHEKWDGMGYPRGLKAEQIPLAARLFAVVDVWDALRSDRPYRAAWPEEKVLEHIRSLAGTHFDPKAVELFLKVIKE